MDERPELDYVSPHLELPGIERALPQQGIRREQRTVRKPHMLFFAVQPPPCAARRIIDLGHRLKDMHKLGSTPYEAHRLHITLQGLGDHLQVPRQFASLACEAIATIAAPRFSATFDRALTLCGRARATDRLAFALAAGKGVAGFSHLKEAIGRILGIRGRASFTPHVTMLYDRKIVRPFPIEPISWTVEEFVLIHAIVKDPNRPKPPYEIVGRWKLY